jgi:hypothetical protein
VGAVLVVGALFVYGLSNPNRNGVYAHFVWQAAAWLEGETAIRYPVGPEAGLGASNEHYQDVIEITRPDGSLSGRGDIPFPPLPAIALLPFVAVFGLATDAQALAAVGGALVVGLVWWLLGALRVHVSVRLVVSVFFAFGTVFWYAAMLGTTWYLAHIVAVGLLTAAIGIALHRDRAAVEEAAAALARPNASTVGPALPGSDVGGSREDVAERWIEPSQLAAGFLLGLAATARLTVLFGLPFLFLVGSGGTVRRSVSAIIGASIPIAALTIYNIAATGEPFNPVYEALYRREIGFYPRIFPYLHYEPTWGIEDPRYISQNLMLMLAGVPETLPPCIGPEDRSLFDPACSWVRPRADGLSILLTSPLYLFALPALRAYGRSRIVTGAAFAVGVIAVVNLMHFSQGWVQFGYRFANDFAPFALLLVALGLERVGGVRTLALVLLGVSMAVCAWGVVWSVTLHW